MFSNGCSRTFAGWLAACGAATVVIVALPLMVLTAASGGSSIGLVRGCIALLPPSFLIFVTTCVMTAFPWAFVVCMAVEFRRRSVLFFACAGAAVGALSIGLFSRSAAILTSGVGGLFVLAGFAAGVTYWCIAGTCAGRDGQSPSDAA